MEEERKPDPDIGAALLLTKAGQGVRRCLQFYSWVHRRGKWKGMSTEKLLDVSQNGQKAETTQTFIT